MKKSKQNKVEPKSKKTIKEKSAISNIETYFQPAQKKNVEVNNNNGCDPQNIYVEALKKKLRDAKDIVQSQGNTKEAKLSKQVGACEVFECERSSEEDSQSKQLGAHCVDTQNICPEVLPEVNDASQSTENAKEILLNKKASALVDCESSGKEDRTSKRVAVHNIDYTDTVRSRAADDVAKQTECARAECVEKALECREWERKYKELKKVYVNLTINYSEENVKYKNLLKVATRATHSGNDEVVISGDSMITSNEINALNRIPLDKPKDSTFIKDSLEYLYKNDLSVLCHMSVKGTSETVQFSTEGEEVKRHPAKSPMTPEKYERVKQLFIDRISKCDIDPVENGKRLNEPYINRLLASGIKNISKKQPKEM